MTNENLYFSIHDIAEQLEVEWEILLQWKYQFDVLPSHISSLTSQLKYTSQAVSMFQLIKEAKQNRLQDKHIHLLLDKHQPNQSLVETMQASINELYKELKEQNTALERESMLREENIKNITWDEWKQLQSLHPDLITLEEEISTNHVPKHPVRTLLQKVIFN